MCCSCEPPPPPPLARGADAGRGGASALRSRLVSRFSRLIGILTGGLLGGAVVIEQVFSLPGVGRLLIGAILSRDMPVIQGGLLLIAVIYLAVNLLIDVVYVAADPRIRVN